MNTYSFNANNNGISKQNSKKEKTFLEKLGFKGKIEKKYLRIMKILDKEKKKNKKVGIKWILDKNKDLLKEINLLVKELEIEQQVNCFNAKIVDIITQNLEQESFMDKKDYLPKLKQYSKDFSNMLEQNALFLSRKLEQGKISFEYKSERIEKIEELEKKKQKENGNKKENHIESYNKSQKYYDFVFYEDLEIIVNDNNMSSLVINSLFKGLVRNIKQQAHSRFFRIFEQVVKHPSLNRQLLKDFLIIQTSKKAEAGYIDVSHADDIDFNYFKKIIIKSKVLKQDEIIPLTTLPYISLWEEVLKEYYLGQYLINDFLDNILKEDYSESERRIVQKFVAGKIVPLNILSGNTEARYRIRDFLTQD